MPKVVLLYDPDCPNVSDARANLSQAFTLTGLRPEWEELDRSAPDTPAEFRRFGSPTILVGGRDIAGAEPISEANSCRVYGTSSGKFTGVPSVEQIAAALRSGRTPQVASAAAGTVNRRGGWKASLSVLPAIGIALLPNVTCPACWPAYGALLSSVGIGFLPTTRYLFPLTVAAVAFALAMLAWQSRTRTRGRFAPLLLATAGAVVLLVGRFGFESDAALYAGVGLLVSGSLWNAWPARLRSVSTELPPACPACSSSAEAHNSPTTTGT